MQAYLFWYVPEGHGPYLVKLDIPGFCIVLDIQWELEVFVHIWGETEGRTSCVFLLKAYL